MDSRICAWTSPRSAVHVFVLQLHCLRALLLTLDCTGARWQQDYQDDNKTFFVFSNHSTTDLSSVDCFDLIIADLMVVVPWTVSGSDLGFRHMIVRPEIVDTPHLTRARARWALPRGNTWVSWERGSVCTGAGTCNRHTYRYGF